MIINPEGFNALIAQLGERQTEDLKVLCSIHSQGTSFFIYFFARNVKEVPRENAKRVRFCSEIINSRFR